MPLINGILVVKKDKVDSNIATASAANILLGKTAVVGKELITGTMPEKAGTTVSGSFDSGTTGYITGKIIQEGHYSTNSKLKIPVTNLSPANIKEGINIGGVTGTLSAGLFSGTVYIKPIYARDNGITFTGYTDLQNKIGMSYTITYNNSKNPPYNVRKRSVSGSSYGSFTDLGDYNSLSDIPNLPLEISHGVITKNGYTEISVIGHTVYWGGRTDQFLFVV